jgi:hypothetical protein
LPEARLLPQGEFQLRHRRNDQQPVAAVVDLAAWRDRSALAAAADAVN